MLAHSGHAATTDLSRWLGPLCPAFAAIAASDEHHGGGTPAHGGDTPAAGPEQTGPAGEPPLAAPAPQTGPSTAELRALFHTLNNQLGVILTYAELLEAKAADDGTRARATQIVSAVIDALETSKKIRGNVIRP